MAEPTDQILGQINRLAARLAKRGQSARVMEVCGTHTMTIARSGLRDVLPDNLELISGPGCPVCVTESSYIDAAGWLATEAGATIATYGDLVRVPGARGSLADARARGADVQVVYSAARAVALARESPGRQVVFLGIGFETTAPGAALAIRQGRREELGNFSVLSAHKLMPPAMTALLSTEDVRIDGFLCPGHVSVIIGTDSYGPLVSRFGRPCVVAGFDPPQVLAGLAEILRQLVEGAPAASSVYPPVSLAGNAEAQRLLTECFEPCDATWRGLGPIAGSGLAIRRELADFDAAKRFKTPRFQSVEPPGCRCGDVICGRAKPAECALFGKRCTPAEPVGPCMVSSEGSCAAAYKYART